MTRAAARGAELRLTFSGRRLALVGPASRRGGRAVAFVDGRRRTVRFRARRTRNRAVIATWRLAPGRHTFRLVSGGGGRVEIDALRVRRR